MMVESRLGGAAEADAHLMARLDDSEQQLLELGGADDVECSIKPDQASRFVMFQRDAHAMLFIGTGVVFREEETERIVI